MSVAQENQQELTLKGGLFPLTTLVLLTDDIEQLEIQLHKKIASAPNFFVNAPIVLDLRNFNDPAQTVNLIEVKNCLLNNKLILVAIKNATAEVCALAAELNLAIIKHSSPATNIKQNVSTNSNIEPTKISHNSIRSGQQFCAAHGDIIINGSVSPGAEILAHGNIHIYGALRGRALAGINGDEKALIFCQSLEAELISIAGHYQVSETIKPCFWKKPVGIRIQQGRLQIFLI